MTASRRVRKAVIPAAGLGTRWLPASKAIPKEMFPIVDKPVIQYVVEGAIASGIEEVILVTSSGKRAIEDHFGRSWKLERNLEHAGKPDLLTEVQRLTELAKFSYVRQETPLGNGHAVLLARELVNEEPFVMLWADDVAWGDPPVVRQMLDAYARMGGCIVAVMKVAPEHTSRYGVIEIADRLDEKLSRVARIVEKPPHDLAPSNLAAVVGYVLTPDIFEILESTPAGRAGEIWLTDGVQRIADQGELYALEFNGRRYDVGDKGEYLQVTVELALDRPDLGPEFQAYLHERLTGRPA